MATYDSYLPSPAQTPAYPHDSPFLRLHSYAPSASSLPPTPSSSTSPSPPAELELEVLCSLFTDALSDPSLGGSSQAMPKTIRVSFGSLPLATKVAQAPPGSIAQQHDEDDDQPKQSLQLRCKIPTREQVVKSGTVVEEDGKVALYCELIARTPQKEDSVVDRVWFGDFDFNGTDNVDGFAVQLDGSRKRAASPLDDDGTGRSRVRYTTHPMYEQGPPTAGFHPIDGGAGGLNVQFGPSSTYDDPALVYEDQSSEFGYSVEHQQPAYLQPFPTSSFTAHTPTSLSPQSPYFPNPPVTYNAPQGYPAHSPSFDSYHHHPPPPQAYLPPQPAPPQPHSRQPSGTHTRETSGQSASKGIYGERAAEGTKASLIIHGDLFSMAVGWTEQEWNARRRLVQFWRKMEGSVIHASFAPIRQEDYEQRSIVISCIFREETNECYVTSVDAIYLLEGLIGARFSIEEKNRVRRNLQRCKPDTISKMKPATEEFFSVLMNFPTPKPRHIEKDIKVFKWKDFGPALERTVAKYSIGAVDNSQIPSPPLAANDGGSDEE